MGDVKVLESWWTRDQDARTVGFVLTENLVGTRKIFMGTARGNDQEVDERAIVVNGGKCSKFLLDSMVMKLTATNKYE